MVTFIAVTLLAILLLSGYNGWIITTLATKGITMALSAETQEQLDRIDAATTSIGSAVTAVGQRIIDLASQIGTGSPNDQTELTAALTAEADKLVKIGDDLTVLASPSDPAVQDPNA